MTVENAEAPKTGMANGASEWNCQEWCLALRSVQPDGVNDGRRQLGTEFGYLGDQNRNCGGCWHRILSWTKKCPKRRDLLGLGDDVTKHSSYMFCEIVCMCKYGARLASKGESSWVPSCETRVVQLPRESSSQWPSRPKRMDRE